MSLIRSIYRTVLSEELRWRIYNRKNIKREKKLLSDIIHFLKSSTHKFSSADVEEVTGYLKENGLHVFPYQFSKQYKAQNIEVFRDENLGLNYVLHEGKKLYFKRSWDKELIKEKYAFLLNEQDEQSAHRYLTKDFSVKEDSVIIDAGVAEGIFVLPLIDQLKHAYLFETDEDWIEALNATFANYKDKVTIINKYVANKDDDMNVKLDTFFGGKEKIDFLKVDVDGAEQELLNGAKELLSCKEPLKIAICTYHKQNDEKDFMTMLGKYDFNCTTSDGFMLFYYDDNFKEPYLRRGIIRAVK